MSDGVDLMEIDGISFHFVLTFLAEVGMDLSAFPTAKHFISWLCLCPNRKMSGGKILSSKTRKNKSLLRQAFRQAAIGLAKKKDTALAYYYRRMAYRHGKMIAINATARRLATIVYNMIQNNEPYRPQSSEVYQKQLRTQKIKHIQRTIKKFSVEQHEVAFG